MPTSQGRYVAPNETRSPAIMAARPNSIIYFLVIDAKSPHDVAQSLECEEGGYVKTKAMSLRADMHLKLAA
jgi:hypothetical protein